LGPIWIPVFLWRQIASDQGNGTHIEVEIPCLINVNNIGWPVMEFVDALNQSWLSAAFLRRKPIRLATALMFVEEAKLHVQSERCFLDQGVIRWQDIMNEI
jgi:hypothetical protein